MSRRLRGCGVGALPALLLLLLGPPATPGITCPTPTSVKHADIWVKSYNLNSRERYVCNSGFKRKAGTSSLTECVFNKTVNIAHWTTPNLKCIKPAFTSRSDTTVATRLATGPCSRLMPSKAPSAGTTGVVNNEPSQVPAQTTAKAPEHTPSALQDPPGAYQYNPRAVTAAISTSVAVLCGVCVVCLLVRYVRYIRSRLRMRRLCRPWLTGPAAPRHVGSSRTRARTRVPCIGRRTLNHCANREALTNLFLYIWLRWVFITVHGLSLVEVSRGYSLLQSTGFSLRWLLLLRSTGSRHVGFSSCGTRASVVVTHGLQSAGSVFVAHSLVAPRHVGASWTSARTRVP
ncbi:interleukin-15 receptor subunit alpha isoform X2 [Pseudorca crassidens]|uniref:interleukin-15 receptor subunit alpha isoform X2 n=1 Tax=Pseudorca crassidens TaxID=82174 RepID=UPI00352E9DCC